MSGVHAESSVLSLIWKGKLLCNPEYSGEYSHSTCESINIDVLTVSGFHFFLMRALVLAYLYASVQNPSSSTACYAYKAWVCSFFWPSATGDGNIFVLVICFQGLLAFTLYLNCKSSSAFHHLSLTPHRSQQQPSDSIVLMDTPFKPSNDWHFLLPMYPLPLVSNSSWPLELAIVYRGLSVVQLPPWWAFMASWSADDSIPKSHFRIYVLGLFLEANFIGLFPEETIPQEWFWT